MRRALTRTLIAASLFLAAAAFGYFLSSSVGQEVVREEIEAQLSRLMQGPVSVENVRLVIHLGLRLEGERVEVYPSPTGPGLSARRVNAEIDVLSLLLGRFKLRSLAVDELLMRIERDAAGTWSPPPLAELQGRRADAADPERHLALLRAFEAVARALLEKPLVADLVVVRDAKVEFVDWLPGGPREAPVALSLESVRGSWDHRWFSTQSELALEGVLVDERSRRTSFEAAGRRLDGGRLHWTVAATELPLDSLQPYGELIGAEGLTGRLSGVVSFETTGAESDSVELDWVMSDVRVEVPWRDEAALIDSRQISLTARLELRPGRLRLARSKLSADEETLELRGFIERPLRESSRTRFSAEIRGIDLDGLRDIVLALPPVDREAFGRVLEPFEKGDLSRVHASARGRLSTWRELWEMRRLTLPPGFLIGAEIDDAVMRLGDGGDDMLSDLDGLIEWTGDRLQTREVNAVWQGERLPEMALSIEGVSNLFATPERERRVAPGAHPMPGLEVFADWLRAWADEEGQESPEERFPWPRVHLTFERMQHPAVFWPLRDVEAVLTLRDDGVDLTLPSGVWAGAPVRGEAVLSEHPKRAFNASIIASPASSPPPDSADPGASTADWLRGRFRIEALDRGPLAFESVEGRLGASGTLASFSDVRAQLVGGGLLEGHVALDFGQGDRVPVDLSAQLVDGDIDRLSGLFGLEPGTVTGKAKLVASLHGPLVPGEKPWARGSGHMSLDAREGEIRRRIPVVVAMAQATEGFNPFSAREAVTYESIQTDFVLDGGVLSSEEFRLEGPMRVFASGSLDLRPLSPVIDAVVGVFLLRQADQLLGKVPIVNWLVSDKGMVGAYFALEGEMADPEVDTLQVKTLAEQTPDIIKAPFRVLRFILLGREREGASGDTRPR